MISNKNIVSALNQLLIDMGWSKRQAARELKVSAPAFLKWLAGGNIRESHWEKLYPVIQKYLEPTEEESRVPVKLKDAYDLLKSVVDNDHLVWLLTTQIRAAVNTFQEIMKPADDKPGIDHSRQPIKFTPLPKFTLRNSKKGEREMILYTGVAAGTGYELEVDFDSHLTVEDFSNDPRTHLVQIKGDSMLPTLEDGDYAIVEKLPFPIYLGPDLGEVPKEKIQSYIPQNTLALFSMGNDEIAVKRFSYYSQNPSSGKWGLYLHADNKEWGNENGFPEETGRLKTMSETMWIYGRVLGKANYNG